MKKSPRDICLEERKYFVKLLRPPQKKKAKKTVQVTKITKKKQRQKLIKIVKCRRETNRRRMSLNERRNVILISENLFSSRQTSILYLTDSTFTNLHPFEAHKLLLIFYPNKSRNIRKISKNRNINTVEISNSRVIRLETSHRKKKKLCSPALFTFNYR